MDQHPVPQNISSYEFRLVGDMTLKQFFQLAGGIGMGVLFWKMPLPPFLKWPLAGLSVITGILLAFVPVSGRPFSQWLMAFIKAIYSPTLYQWSSTPAQPMEVVLNPTSQESSSPLDKIESQVFNRIGQLFNAQPQQTAPVVQTPAPTPVETPPTPIVETVAPPAPKPPPAPVATLPPPPKTPDPGQMEPKRPIMVAEIVDTPPPPRMEASPVTVEATPLSNIAPITSTPVVAKPAEFTDQMTAPPRENMIAGMVVGLDKQPIEGVILEISDSKNGIPVRALRSNKLGQFQTATQLAPGNYVLTGEKDGLNFDPIAVICENKVISPILVSAHG